MRTQRKVLQDSKVKSILTPRPIPGSGLEFGYIDVRDEEEGEEHTLLRWFELLTQKGFFQHQHSSQPLCPRRRCRSRKPPQICSHRAERGEHNSIGELFKNILTYHD